MTKETETTHVDRRNFFQIAIGAIGGIIAAGYAIPGIGYVISPALEEKTEGWIPLGSADNIPLHSPVLLKAKVTQKIGWLTEFKEYGVYVFTDDGENYKALSNVCTHLGCHVRWDEDQEAYTCPCHNAAFDLYGQVLHGPPPRPMDEVTIKIEDGKIFMFGG